MLDHTTLIVSSSLLKKQFNWKHVEFDVPRHGPIALMGGQWAVALPYLHVTIQNPDAMAHPCLTN